MSLCIFIEEYDKPTEVAEDVSEGECVCGCVYGCEHGCESVYTHWCIHECIYMGVCFFGFGFFFLLFRATPAAYGDSEARGRIGAVAAGYATTTPPDPSHLCDLHHSSWQCRALNPLSEARDQTCVLMDASPVCFC